MPEKTALPNIYRMQIPLAILFVAIASALGYILMLQEVELGKTPITELD